MSSPSIPAVLLNIPAYSLADLVLGGLCFVFQIASLAISPHIVYEQIGIGFWGGIVLAITGIAAYKAISDNGPFMLGCSFILSVFSLIISFSIMCIFAAALDQMHRYPDPCLGYINVSVPPTTDCKPFNVTVDIPRCGDYSSGRNAVDALLLIFGLVGIPVNTLLTVSIIASSSPSSTVGA